MDIITSVQNRRVKYVKSLGAKGRLRRSEKKLILEGDRLIKDALNSGGRPDLALYTPESADYELIAILQNRNCELLPVSEGVLSHVSDTMRAPGILGVFQIPKPPIPNRAEQVLILDAVREPGNMGTVLRSAAAAGADIAILAPGCVDPYRSKVLRAGMGVHFRLPVAEAKWQEIRAYCAGLAVYSADAAGETIYTEVDWGQPWALVVGNEAHGISADARRISRSNVSVPMSHEAESLNVASAATVILFEAKRQRLNGANHPRH
ncbi:MAG: RNA methyltransferase [Chloroflexi bacterium]|nr:RNA methyltransferase [Chloroflexota bacterium]